MNPLPYSRLPAPVAVVGVGNWLVSCDRIGPNVLQKCSQRFGPEIDLIEIGCVGLALLDHIAKQELMIIVDACCGMGARGEIMVREPDLNSFETTAGGCHQIGAMETLVVANFLYPERLPRKLVLILAETNGLNTLEMEKACDRITGLIEEKIETWQHRRN